MLGKIVQVVYTRDVMLFLKIQNLSKNGLHEANWRDVNNELNFYCIKIDIILEYLIRYIKNQFQTVN